MKTLLFTLEYPPFHGGIANYYGNLVKNWPSQLEANKIFVLDNNQGLLINNKLPLLKWLPAYFALAKKIKKERIDHIIIGQILPLGTVALFYSKLHKIKTSIFLHGMDFNLAIATPRKKILSRKILKNTDKIICSNSYVADLAGKNFPEVKNKIIVVNPGIDKITKFDEQSTNLLKKKYNIENKKILLSVGRLVKRKGFDMVIKAMPEISEKIPDLIYVIIGDGPEYENYQEQKNVLIIKNASDQERNLWYNICDIFIMPSRNIKGDFEGFGIVYLEANMAGKPVIAGKSGGVEDAVINGLNGLLIDPENIKEITDSVIKLTKDQILRQKLGEQGKARAINDFNWPKQINKIYNFLNL